MAYRYSKVTQILTRYCIFIKGFKSMNIILRSSINLRITMLTKSKHIMTSCQLLSNQPNWPNPAFLAHELKSCPYEINQMVEMANGTMVYSQLS